MPFLPFLDGLVELLDIGFRSRAKFAPGSFRIILLNDTDLMTQNATLISVLGRESLNSEGYSRSIWAPSGAAIKNTGANTVAFASVIVNIVKAATPAIATQYDCAVLLADGSAIANRLITAITANAFQVASHGLIAGDRVFFTGASAYPSLILADTFYFVVSTGLTTDQFRVAATSGGSAIAAGSSFTGDLVVRYANGVAIGFDKVPNDGGGNNTRNLQASQTLEITAQVGNT